MPIGPTPQLKSGLFGRGGPGKPDPATAKPPPPKGPSGLRVEHRIGVHAPAAVVWEIVRDLAAWADWNPTYPQADGELRIGAELSLTLALPGAAPRPLKATVVDWVPNEQLLWRTRAMGGLVSSLRYIEIEQLAEGSCIVDNGEIFGGFLGPSTARPLARKVYRGFAAMNEALKARAEAQAEAQAAR